jgi:hypothetical protein
MPCTRSKPHTPLRGTAVVPLARGPRVPPLTPVCLSKGRIEGADEVAKGLTTHTLHTPLLGTEEDPGVLCLIPKQCCLHSLLSTSPPRSIGSGKGLSWASPHDSPANRSGSGTVAALGFRGNRRDSKGTRSTTDDPLCLGSVGYGRGLTGQIGRRKPTRRHCRKHRGAGNAWEHWTPWSSYADAA